MKLWLLLLLSSLLTSSAGAQALVGIDRVLVEKSPLSFTVITMRGLPYRFLPSFELGEYEYSRGSLSLECRDRQGQRKIQLPLVSMAGKYFKAVVPVQSFAPVQSDLVINKITLDMCYLPRITQAGRSAIQYSAERVVSTPILTLADNNVFASRIEIKASFK